MKVYVDRNLCENHGQCALVAEDVFQMNDGGILEYDPEPQDERHDEVVEAADLCPVQAIFVGAADETAAAGAGH